MKWPAASTEILDKMIRAKPDMFRKKAEAEIRKRAEEICRAAGLEEITPRILAEANYAVTPEEFRPFVEIDLNKMGFNSTVFKRKQ